VLPPFRTLRRSRERPANTFDEHPDECGLSTSGLNERRSLVKCCRVEQGRSVVPRAKVEVLAAQDESDIGVFGRTIDTIGFEIHAFLQ
jgi:hypothetical protein